MSPFEVGPDSPRAPDVAPLLAAHEAFATRVLDVHEIDNVDADRLAAPEMSFFTARERDGGRLLGMGALCHLRVGVAEITSMHTFEDERGRGVGRAIVDHLLAVASARGCVRVLLETGDTPAFDAAKAMYHGAGFTGIDHDAPYPVSDNTRCMALDLAPAPPSPAARTVDDMLARDRAGLSRVSVDVAARRVGAGARLVDVRTTDQIRADGHVPGALEVSLNVLEWRLDPASPDRHPDAPGIDQQVLVLCDEGYCSSLAAARLQELGFSRATDVIDGFRAWRAAGLPVTPPTGPARSRPLVDDPAC